MRTEVAATTDGFVHGGGSGDGQRVDHFRVGTVHVPHHDRASPERQLRAGGAHSADATAASHPLGWPAMSDLEVHETIVDTASDGEPMAVLGSPAG